MDDKLYVPNSIGDLTREEILSVIFAIWPDAKVEELDEDDSRVAIYTVVNISDSQ